MLGDARPGAGPPASMVAADLPRAVCGKQSAHVELVAPGELPAGWADWDSRRQESYNRHHDPGRWRFIYDGRAGLRPESGLKSRPDKGLWLIR